MYDTICPRCGNEKKLDNEMCGLCEIVSVSEEANLYILEDVRKLMFDAIRYWVDDDMDAVIAVNRISEALMKNGYKIEKEDQ